MNAQLVPMPAVTSSDMQLALRLRFPTGQHALLWEVADATGSNQRRFADAVAIGLWPSHGHEIEGIEVKVSRSDWLRERANPEKSQAVFQYCHRFWLACPKGMVEPGELPPTWGMLELVGSVLRVKVKAPKLTPARLGIGFVASMLRRHAGIDEDAIRQRIDVEVDRRAKENHERIEREIRLRVSHEVEQSRKAMLLLEEIKEATGIDLLSYKPSAHWVEGIRFATGERWGKAFTAEQCAGLRLQLAQMQQALEPFADMAPNVQGFE